MSTDNTNSSNDAANSTNGNNANRSKRKNPNSNLNNHYTVLLEGGLIVALVIFIIAMNVNLHSSKNKGPTAKKQNVVKMKKVQQTQQKKKPPPPAAPVVPVKVPNDVTLKNQVSFDVDINNHQDLPAPPKEHHASKGKKSKEKIFVAVGTMPKLKKGYAALQKKVKYPASCRNANIQGRVTVQFVVNKQGVPTNVHVTRGIGGGCDEAAVNAVKKYARFTVGRQRGKAVKVRMSLPIVFRLQH